MQVQSAECLGKDVQLSPEMPLEGRSWPDGLQRIEEDAEVEALYCRLFEDSTQETALPAGLPPHALFALFTTDLCDCREELHRRVAYHTFTCLGGRCAAPAVCALACWAEDIWAEYVCLCKRNAHANPQC